MFYKWSCDSKIPKFFHENSLAILLTKIFNITTSTALYRAFSFSNLERTRRSGFLLCNQVDLLSVCLSHSLTQSLQAGFYSTPYTGDSVRQAGVLRHLRRIIIISIFMLQVFIYAILYTSLPYHYLLKYTPQHKSP